MTTDPETLPGVTPLEWQLAALQVPETVDLAFLGGRGGGKSYLLALLVVQGVVLHGNRFRALVLRQSFPSLADLLSIFREVFAAAFGTSATYNQTSHCWYFATGATCEFGYLDGEESYSRFQGRSFSHLIVDEAGQFASPAMLDRALSNLRGPCGTPGRRVIAANPGSCGHQWLARRYAFATPGVVSECPDTKRPFVHLPSTFRDNDRIDRALYRQRLVSATSTDLALQASYVDGDWSVLRGMALADVLSETRSAVDPLLWTPSFFLVNPFADSPDPVLRLEGRPQWDRCLTIDWGSSSPTAAFILARSPGAEGPCGKWFPRGSVVAVDEFSTHDPLDPSRGRGLLVPQVAEQLRAMCFRWGVDPLGWQNVGDDAMHAAHGHGVGSLADEFLGEGLRLRPALKGGRISSVERLKTMLMQAGTDKPGLYLSRACTMAWQTLPTLPRDPKRPDDVDSRGLDHWFDALRYGLGAQTGHFSCGHTKELWGKRRPW